MPNVTDVRVTLIAQGDGKDQDTGCIVWTNLANGTQFSHYDFSDLDIGDNESASEQMIVDDHPTESDVEGGFQIRIKWFPVGNDTFNGAAQVEVTYDGSSTRRYVWQNMTLNESIDMYYFPFAGPGQTE